MRVLIIILTFMQFWDKFLLVLMQLLPEIQTPFQIRTHILEYLHHLVYLHQKPTGAHHFGDSAKPDKTMNEHSTSFYIITSLFLNITFRQI